MRRYVPALGSFVLGAVSMFLFSGIDTSTIVQRCLAQVTTPPPDPSRELAKKFGPFMIFAPGAIPTVPDQSFDLRGENTGGIQQLDGMNCNGCTLKVNLLTYAGGQFNCTNCKISSVNGVLLQGTAENTLKVLQLIGAIPRAPAPGPDNPNAPQLYKIKTTSNEERLNWVSLSR